MVSDDKTVFDGDKTSEKAVTPPDLEPDTGLIFGWLIDPEKESSFRISRERINIGSDASCDVIVKGEEIEKLHCFIYFEEGRFELNDNNTHGRTRLNGKVARREYLDDGNEILIGDKKFVFRCFRSRT